MSENSHSAPKTAARYPMTLLRRLVLGAILLPPFVGVTRTSGPEHDVMVREVPQVIPDRSPTAALGSKKSRVQFKNLKCYASDLPDKK